MRSWGRPWAACPTNVLGELKRRADEKKKHTPSYPSILSPRLPPHPSPAAARAPPSTIKHRLRGHCYY